ncbi:MAG: hypothetical protein ACRD0Y_11205 [Terriglobales bacterium]
MSLSRILTPAGVFALIACLPLLAVTPMAPGAILTPTAGVVAVNGSAATAGVALLPGDVIATSARGSARMVLPGAAVIAAARTRFQVIRAAGALRLRLRGGLIEVFGTLPVAVAARTVLADGPNAYFDVAALAGEVYVTAVRGRVMVKSASASYEVPAGKTVKFRASQSLPAPVKMKKPGLSLLTVAAGTVAAAAAAGAVVYLINRKKNSTVSPSSL